MTPEGRVKAKVKAIIAAYNPHVYSHWPVMNGMGQPTLDCNGCVNGEAFYIETKRPGEKLTQRQELTRASMEAAKGMVFKLDGDELQLAEFDAWLHHRVMRAIARTIK